MEIKKLTRKDIRALREAGLDLTLLDEKERTDKKAFEMVDWIIDHVYGDVPNIDEIPYQELFDIGLKTYRQAYGRDEEIKN